MNASKIIALLSAALPILIVLVFALPAAGKPDDNIILGRADTVRETSVSAQQGLLNAIAGAGARVVVDYANAVRHIGLPALPGDLQTQLDRVAARVVSDSANTVRHSNLPPVPTGLQALFDQVAARVVVADSNSIRHYGLPPVAVGLQTLLGQVTDRIVFQRANSSREPRVRYPAALINDTTPPSVDSLAVKAAGSNFAVATWRTDEFADSEVRYGEQPEQYSRTVRDPLYVTQHIITMTLLIPGTTYYYKLRSSDLSDNVYLSPEYSFDFSPKTSIYLPLLLR